MGRPFRHDRIQDGRETPTGRQRARPRACFRPRIRPRGPGQVGRSHTTGSPNARFALDEGLCRLAKLAAPARAGVIRGSSRGGSGRHRPRQAHPARSSGGRRRFWSPGGAIAEPGFEAVPGLWPPSRAQAAPASSVTATGKPPRRRPLAPRPRSRSCAVAGSRAWRVTRQPRSWSSRAVASPITPQPSTAARRSRPAAATSASRTASSDRPPRQRDAAPAMAVVVDDGLLANPRRMQHQPGRAVRSEAADAPDDTVPGHVDGSERRRLVTAHTEEPLSDPPPPSSSPRYRPGA